MRADEKMRDEIARVAYDIWERSGRVDGRDRENWLEAERIIMARLAEKSKLKEETKKAITWENLPVEMKKTAPAEMKNEAIEKKTVPAEMKTEMKKEAPVKKEAAVKKTAPEEKGAPEKKTAARKTTRKADLPKEARKTK